MIWVDHISSRYHLTLNQSFANYLDSTQSPSVGQWQHLATTFDGSTAHFYIDGAQVASRAYSGDVGASDTWRIGAYGSSPGGFLDGVVDDIRVYDRALSAAEVQADMDTPVPAPDTTPPGAPGTLNATGGPGRVDLAWGPASDNVGVTSYDVHRSTTAGFTASDETRVGETADTTYTDAPLAAGTYHYRVAARDAAGNVGPIGNEASATATADTTPPAVAITAPAAGATVFGIATVTAAATDNGSIAGVQFKVDNQNVGAEDTSSPYTLAWDTRAELNGAHTLTAVARDVADNTATSTPIQVTVSNAGVSSTGLRGAWAFDEGSGAVAADWSGVHNTATLVGAGWASTGYFGAAVSLSGSASEVDPPALGTFYKTGFTYEAWVFKQSNKTDVAVVGSWSSSLGGAMIWVDHVTGHYRLTLGSAFGDYLDSGQAPAVGRWQHVAATYDGTTARIYLDGSLAATKSFTGNVGDTNVWRIGAYGASATGFFDGQVDNLRIYDRALSAPEVASNMASRVQPETDPPAVLGTTPASAATGISVGASVTATFDEPMKATSITGSTFQLRDSNNALVTATVTFDFATGVATLSSGQVLSYGMTYTATVKGGTNGVRDLSGNPMAADKTWSFATEASPPPVLVVGSTGNKFWSYLVEILKAEGLSSYTALDAAFISPALLAQFNVVILGETPLAPAQVSALTGWVNGGGNLIAMRPDKQLASLLGVTDLGTTLSNAYLDVITSSDPGKGITGTSMQYHGTADRYLLNGATSVATLYSARSTATVSPAVTLRSVGTSGGQAAAFMYDLARSVVLTRQGNPAWAGQERDGEVGIRPDDLFFGAKVGDVQPDWVDKNRIALPQADEQQRLLANMITFMLRDKLPLPRFWYLPRDEKAVVVMSGDDHAGGGTAFHFDRFKSLSPAGCVVSAWECVRSTSYIYPNSPLTNTQAAAYVADGFEVALHPKHLTCPPVPISEAELDALFDTQLAAFQSSYPSVPPSVSSRIHCVFWPGWTTSARVERDHGMRMDANYYHYPGSWIGTTPGFLNGGGFPMRLAETDGTLLDVYQANTNMTDESGQTYPSTVNTLLNNATGALGYFGAFGANMHTDYSTPHPGAEAIVAAAQAHSVPVISYKQLLDWTEGRNNSTISGLSWNAGTFTFTTAAAAGSNGLQTMLPTTGPVGTLRTLRKNGVAVSFSKVTIKGIQYARFTTTTGTFVATYS